ncbi:unnamed protein product, partial [Medioppia subpectinata]
MSGESVADARQLEQHFRSVDRDGSGHINASELQSALSNGTFRPFDIQTISLMIAMFDSQNSKTIDFADFTRLWRYVTDWLKCFQSFDGDNSGHIDARELAKALTAFGYRFSDEFYANLL